MSCFIHSISPASWHPTVVGKHKAMQARPHIFKAGRFNAQNVAAMEIRRNTAHAFPLLFFLPK